MLVNNKYICYTTVANNLKFYPCKEGETKCHITRQKQTQNLVNRFTNT